ncbi:MAG: hypothetical protein H6713_42440 [Myxococcales bacterium]|nr:hypothetical protein [Myxococcales bacterium]
MRPRLPPSSLLVAALVSCQQSPDGEMALWDAPDCATVDLPGPASDVAATPRSDRDAELLALTVAPDAIAAPQAIYERIAADLAAIRALDPALEDVHPECDDRRALSIWFHASQDVLDAILAGEYHAWDCHNAYFGIDELERIDGVAFSLPFSGVLGDGIKDVYAAIPGLEDVDIFVCDEDPYACPSCPEGSASITVEVFEDDGVGARQYRFVWADGADEVAYRVEPGQAPEPVG